MNEMRSFQLLIKIIPSCSCALCTSKMFLWLHQCLSLSAPGVCCLLSAHRARLCAAHPLLSLCWKQWDELIIYFNTEPKSLRSFAGFPSNSLWPCPVVRNGLNQRYVYERKVEKVIGHVFVLGIPNWNQPLCASVQAGGDGPVHDPCPWAPPANASQLAGKRGEIYFVCNKADYHR